MNEPEPDYEPKSRPSHTPSGPPAETLPNGSAPDGSEAGSVDGSGQPSETSSGPANDSPTPASRVRDALSALVQRPSRDPVTQRFVGPGPNIAAGKTLARSANFWTALEPLKQELVERVRTDLAVDASSVETVLGLIDGYVEARLFRSSMFLRLAEQGGPITNKGRTRALYTAYLAALDRETKLAQVLGLERRARKVPSLAEVMNHAE